MLISSIRPNWEIRALVLFHVYTYKTNAKIILKYAWKSITKTDIDARKPGFAVYEQQRRRPVCASPQSGQRLLIRSSANLLYIFVSSRPKISLHPYTSYRQTLQMCRVSVDELWHFHATTAERHRPRKILKPTSNRQF